MLRLWTYLILLVIVAFLARDAATWAWVAYNTPVATAGSALPAPPPTDAKNGGASPAKLAEIDKRPLAAFPQTVSRPVFFEGRHYPVREAKKPAPQVVERAPTVNVKELKLLGVRVEAGASQALIAVGAQPPAWVNVGERVMAWTVTSVDANEVMVEHEGQKADLKLYEP